MNLFRSEDHIRNWARYDSAAEQGILPLESVVKVFSEKAFQKRLDSDYVSRTKEYWGDVLSLLSEIAKTRPFWTPAGPQ